MTNQAFAKLKPGDVVEYAGVARRVMHTQSENGETTSASFVVEIFPADASSCILLIEPSGG